MLVEKERENLEWLDKWANNTMTEEQREHIEWLNDNYVCIWELTDYFQEQWPSMFDEAVRVVCNNYSIDPVIFDSQDETWQEMCAEGDDEKIWLDLKYELLDRAGFNKEEE